QLELARRGTPYQITSGVRFFGQAHIKDVAAFVRFVANPCDEVAFKRMVRLLPGIGGKTAENLWSAWEKSMNEKGEVDSWRARLLQLNVSVRSKKSWEQLVHTLEEIAPAGKPNPPSEMLISVVEAIYDDYAKANFINYELRREDLNQLAAFARQFADAQEFLSQLALISKDRKSTRLNSSHLVISYAVFCLK